MGVIVLVNGINRYISVRREVLCGVVHPDTLQYIENRINSTVSQSTGYAPIELLNGQSRPDIFRKILTFIGRAI